MKIAQFSPPGTVGMETAEFDLDALIEPVLLDAVAALDGRAPLLTGMVRYHLGYAGRDLQPLDRRAVDRGKRMRPAVALLAAGAAGGDPRAAAPVGAAVELLHNFSLIHDDVQDESPTRRHRPTVWSLWGVGQAINAGDALFAAAHLPLYRLASSGVTADLSLRLLEAFDRMTIAIVEGQTLDLAFEARSDVSAGEYLEMIAGKTAAIVRFAAWAGALLGGADEAAATRWAEFGLALGSRFSVPRRSPRYLGCAGSYRQSARRRRATPQAVAADLDLARPAGRRRAVGARPPVCRAECRSMPAWHAYSRSWSARRCVRRSRL